MAGWKDILRVVAPTAATLLGGPGAGAAVQMLSRTLLSKDNATEDELAAAVGSLTPADLQRLREADLALRVEQIRAGVRIEELEVEHRRVDSADRDSARKREIATGDWTPRMIALGLLCAWVGAQYLLLTTVVDSSMRELVARVLGTMDAGLMLVLNYYFGSSRGSDRKTELLQKSAEAAK